jgi:hypothetical protein
MNDAGTDTAERPSVAESISLEYHDLPQDRERLGSVRRRLDETGYAALEGFLTEAAHAQLKRQVLDLERFATSSTEGGNRKFAFKGEQLEATVVGALARSQWLLDLVNGILGPIDGSAAYIKQPIEPEDVKMGLNIMRKPTDVTAFHFDGSYLNLIVPVVIPALTGPRRGQLVMYPNRRSFARGPWQKYVVSALAHSGMVRRFWSRVEIDYRERGIYMFYGYRSLHGVERQPEPALRCITNMTIGQRHFS